MVIIIKNIVIIKFLWLVGIVGLRIFRLVFVFIVMKKIGMIILEIGWISFFNFCFIFFWFKLFKINLVVKVFNIVFKWIVVLI